MDALRTREVLRMAKLGWILEKLGKNFRQYFNAKNPKQHKTTVDALDPSDEWQVGASGDDVLRYGTNSFSTTANHFSVGYYDSGGPYKSCARFTNIGIPQGATINSAYLKIKAYNTQSGTVVYSNIKGEDVDNATQITSQYEFDTRERTSAFVAWDNIGGWTYDVWYTSPDIKSVIQEIVDRAEWASGNAMNIFWEDDGSDAGARRYGVAYDYNTEKAPKLEITWTEGGGQTYEINVDAVVKASAEKSLQTTFNIEKDAVTAGSATHGEESTLNILKEALVEVLADVTVEKLAGQLIEIFKDAVVQAQASFSLESIFNITNDAIVNASAIASLETIFNVVKDAIIKTSAAPQVVGVYPINIDAAVKASATPSLQQTLGIRKDAVVVAVSTPLIQSIFNISPEAVVKVLAEVSVVKEGEVKVTKLFLMLGNIAIQIQGE